MATSRSSAADDPMDLGPFLQNYVMKNPFRALQQQQVPGDGRGGAAGGRAPPPRWTLRPRRPRGCNDDAGVSGSSSAASASTDVSEMLLCNDDASRHGDDVTAW